MKYKTRNKDDILFDKHHPNPLSNLQQPSTTPECKTFVAFVGSLSTNKNIENTIKRSHYETDAKQNIITLILFALFIS